MAQVKRHRAIELRDGDAAGPAVEEGPAPSLREGRRGVDVIGPVGPSDEAGRRAVEVVVDGWRFEFQVEDADRAALRALATRDRGGSGAAAGPHEIRAIIPGRVAAVLAAEGDSVSAGQPLLIVEAMKMQNELKAPRDGRVSRIGAAAGATIEIGDLLVVLA